MSHGCARTTSMQLAILAEDQVRSGVETFRLVDDTIRREVLRRNGSTAMSSLSPPEPCLAPGLDRLFDKAWLTSTVAPPVSDPTGVVRVVDLFAGCGGLSLGVLEACRALQLEMWSVMANDVDPDALAIYGLNFPESHLVDEPIESFLDSPTGEPLSASEQKLRRNLGDIDLVIGGPPCQGHSDLNNHTRNSDPKNELYLRMARFCEVVKPRHVIIENVPGVERDRRRVAQRTWRLLTELGYKIDSGVVNAVSVGVAQRRKRSLTIASLEVSPNIPTAIADVGAEERDLRWAIGDLVATDHERIFDSPPTPNDTNANRIDFLFDNDLHELPDQQRPDCHRLKEHTYVSVYGRLHWDRPAPTVTTGFGSMGRGRYVHPSERRTLTPHEAARVQFFPDFFDFGRSRRTLLQKTIGNAVPPKMGYALGLHLLR